IRTEVTEPRWKESKVKQQVELERSRFQTLGIMSAGLAHELRQPLQTIRTEAGNIRDHLLQLKIDDQDIREAQESIDTNIERIDRNIRHVAAIASGSIEDIEEIDLATFVRDQCDLLRPYCNQAEIELKVSTPDHQSAHVNVITISTVLLSFVRNAIDALAPLNGNAKKWIKVTLSKNQDNHVLEVTDNGPGIDDDIRSSIFRRFASKKTGGQGVGLFYCNHLVSYHGGSAHFNSRVGLGTSFRVELPEGK
ncbi:MAG: sensor histidine kinase, partial [Blastocatellia bacterium]